MAELVQFLWVWVCLAYGTVRVQPSGVALIGTCLACLAAGVVLSSGPRNVLAGGLVALVTVPTQCGFGS
jgi:hypothetical protein